MELNSPLAAYIAREIGYYDDDGLSMWANEVIPKNDEYINNEYLIELYSLLPGSNNKAQDLLRLYIETQRPDFSMSSKEAENVAVLWLSLRLKEYIDGKRLPWELCRMVQPIESFYDFPKWLGNLFNSCDWLGPDSKSEDCKHLVVEAQTLLDSLTSRCTGADYS